MEPKNEYGWKQFRIKSHVFFYYYFENFGRNN